MIELANKNYVGHYEDDPHIGRIFVFDKLERLWIEDQRIWVMSKYVVITPIEEMV